MSRQHRIEKSEKQLRALEEAFTSELREALHLAAQGQWGIFGGYLTLPHARGLNDNYNQLHALGDEIDSLRTELGMPAFELYARYTEYCRRHGANDPGEPRLAKEFLNELDATGRADRIITE